MNYNPLGKSKLKVSEIGFGCMSLDQGASTNNRLLLEALDHGINFFDTADLYQKGENEITVGKALQSRRKEAIIATKVGNQWRADGSGWDWNPSREYILSSVDQSLKRLQTDYIDLYQLHGGTLDDPIDDTIEAFETLVSQGKIRYYGISSIRPNVIREYVARSNIVSVMMQYSLADRRPEESCLPLLAEHQIGVLARGTLAKGMLIDKKPQQYLDHSSDEMMVVSKAVDSLTRGNRSKTQVTLEFVLNHPTVTCAAVGIRTFDQLNRLKDWNPSAPLGNDEIEALSNIIRSSRYAEHR